jgi:hypothetical protein
LWHRVVIPVTATAALRLAVAGPLISIGLSLFTSRAQTFLLFLLKARTGERDPALEEEDPGKRVNEVEEIVSIRWVHVLVSLCPFDSGRGLVAVLLGYIARRRSSWFLSEWSRRTGNPDHVHENIDIARGHQVARVSESSLRPLAFDPAAYDQKSNVNSGQSPEDNRQKTSTAA